MEFLPDDTKNKLPILALMAIHEKLVLPNPGQF